MRRMKAFTNLCTGLWDARLENKVPHLEISNAFIQRYYWLCESGQPLKYWHEAEDEIFLPTLSSCKWLMWYKGIWLLLTFSRKTCWYQTGQITVKQSSKEPLHNHWHIGNGGGRSSWHRNDKKLHAFSADFGCCIKLSMPKLVSLMPEEPSIPRAVQQLGQQKMMQKSPKFNWVIPHLLLPLSLLRKRYSPKLHLMYFHSPFWEFCNKERLFFFLYEELCSGWEKQNKTTPNKQRTPTNNKKKDRHWFSHIYMYIR